MSDSLLHTLLATTDLSAASSRSSLRAAMLAKQVGAQLELVHVLEKSALDELQQLYGQDYEVIQKNIRTQARKELSRLTSQLTKTLGKNVECHLVAGEVLESILAQVKTLDAKILVLGERGVGGFVRQLLLGTTTERLMRLSTCPVLVVKRPPREAYRSVIVPVDFSPWSIRAIHLARAVAPKAELTLLHAYEVPFEYKMRIAWEKEGVIRRYRETARQEAETHLHKVAEEAGVSTIGCNFILVRGNATHHILEQEEEQGADLIILGKHGIGMVEELLLGSCAKQIATQSLCDVLIANH